VAYRLAGALDDVRLRAAFNDVVARHAILRTNYGVDSEGEPYQTFCDDVEIIWRTGDLTQLSGEARERQIEVLAREEFGRPFDLNNELPLRVTLLRTGADEFVLLLVVHHISWDDDSWAIFLADLTAAYNGRQDGAPAPQFVSVEVLQIPAE